MFSRLRRINRRWLWAGALLAAVGAPAAVTSLDEVPSLVDDAWESVSFGSADRDGDVGLSAEFREKPAPPLVEPVEGPPTANLGDVLRFDVTTAWIMGRWPRVSAGLSEVDLQGYRVPLVTGTREHDLAGALTYYFNRDQRVEKITFRGTTGDARPLVAVMARSHGFLRQAASDSAVHLYTSRRGEGAAGQMTIRPARVVRSNVPHNRFEVELEMLRPRVVR